MTVEELRRIRHEKVLSPIEMILINEIIALKLAQQREAKYSEPPANDGAL